MKRSKHLFQLIKSLSKSEKRSFKLFANRNTIGEKNNYIQLFDVIDKQDKYDEALLIKKLKDPKLTKNLSSVKVQLYNLILKNLRQYNATNKTIYHLRMQMDYIDILFEKGLYSQCKKVLKKAQETARKSENHIILDSLSVYEYQIAVKESNYNNLENYINNSYPEVKKIRDTNIMLAEYEYLLASIKLLVLKSNRTGHSVEKKKFDQIVKHKLLSENPNKHPRICQEEYHTIWGYYYNIMGDKDKTYYHRKKVIELLEENIDEVIELPKIWIENARLLLISLGTYKMYDEFDKEQNIIKKFIDKISESKKTQNLNAEIYNTIYNTKLDFDIDRGLFKTCSEYIKDAEIHFKTYENQIGLNSTMVMYFNFSYAYFGNGEYQKSLKWINKLINNNYGNVRMDLQCMAQIMNIAIHYELKNYEFITSLVRSTNRFLTKVNRKFKVETSFLKFANKSFKNQYSKDLKPIFEKEIDELNQIIKDPFEKRILEYFDIISWIKTKTEEKSMEQIMSKFVIKEKISRGVM